MIYSISKRKIARAVKVALEDQKIPTADYQFYKINGLRPEYGLHWPETQTYARIVVREDSTLYISNAYGYEIGSPFETWIEYWEGPER